MQHTLEADGRPLRVLIRTLANGERIAVAQEAGVRDVVARESAWRTAMPLLFLYLHHPHGDHVDEHKIEVSATNPDKCTPDHGGHEPGHVHGPGAGTRPYRMAIMSIIWSTAAFITLTATTVMTTAR